MTPVVRVEEVLPKGPRATSPVARVGVLVSLNFPEMDEQVAALVRRFTRVALEALQELDATFELFDTSRPLSDPEAVAACDGLMLLGGGDIDPTGYSSTIGDVPNGYGIDRRADQDALAALAVAERAQLPILGICRGAQLINVHRGGTLIPDIEDFTLHRGGPGQPMFIDEEIRVEPGTRLRSVLAADRIMARSGHHQAVARVGRDLVPAARALDGIVEAVEDPSRWVVGVQWHPEDDDGPADDRRRLIRAFIAACAGRRAAPLDPRPTTTSSALR